MTIVPAASTTAEIIDMASHPQRRVRAIDAIGRELVELAGELEQAADSDEIARASLVDLATLLEFVACRLGGIEIALEDPRVKDLEVLCLCGHDRGEHLCEAPHVCEGAACLCIRFEEEEDAHQSTDELLAGYERAELVLACDLMVSRLVALSSRALFEDVGEAVDLLRLLASGLEEHSAKRRTPAESMRAPS